MKSATAHPIHALLFGLSDDLAVELAKPLNSLCSVRSADSNTDISDPHIIFCGPDTRVVGELRSARPKAAIVVVSRHPEVSCWLDSIEAGANDYCAAPFEPSQMKWLLDSSLQSAHQRQ
jgi:DNA-binding NtrC family response regulator